ncbi:hypothetical protein C7447_102256 [Tenacibaculum adriaticum]|uniref:Uncharacterized protein n=1 Tax=Tenacibaculum adriaticum TaxID=413713 RepID=A0A5S5DU96_9FLAO|nr:hypothetical protein C7447_102256 [Tenacibaculum adriaticum]
MLSDNLTLLFCERRDSLTSNLSYLRDLLSSDSVFTSDIYILIGGYISAITEELHSIDSFLYCAKQTDLSSKSLCNLLNSFNDAL